MTPAANSAPAASASGIRPLSTVLVTERLSQRVARPPDIEAENRALHALAHALRRSPRAALDALVRAALVLCRPDENATTGVSLLEVDPTAEDAVFRWTVMAGRLAHRVGGSTPRSFSPCGVCLDEGRPVLFDRPDTHFTYFQESGLPFIEGLVLPFNVNRKPAGTIWIVAHDDAREFDREDVRIMSSLAEFTGIVYDVLETREAVDSARDALTLARPDDATRERSGQQHGRSVAVAECARALSAGGIVAALRVLNARTRFRFTGIFCAEPPLLRNVALFDRENPTVNVSGGVSSLADTYCGITCAESTPFVTTDARNDLRLATHAARDSTQSYAGAPIRLPSGRVWGTLCHFDLRPRCLAVDEVGVLEAAAPLFRPWLDEYSAMPDSP